MNYSIDLQAPLSDKAYWLILLIALALLAAVFAFFFARMYKKLKALRDNKGNIEEPVMAPVGPIINPASVKDRAMAEIARIEANYNNRQITSRQAALELSIAVRLFLKAMTGREADCNTYEELRKWGYTALTILMNSLYGIEFAEHKDIEVDMNACIQDARKLVAGWT